MELLKSTEKKLLGKNVLVIGEEIEQGSEE